MNVTNWLMASGNMDIAGTSVQPLATVAQPGLDGQPAQAGQASFAALFSLQLGEALLPKNTEQSDSLLLNASVDEEEQAALLEKLLLLLQEQLGVNGWSQLTANGQDYQQAAQLAEKLGQELQLMVEAGKLNRQTLLSTFMQQGLSQQQAAELADLLTATLQQGKQAEQLPAKQTAEAIAQLVDKWGGKSVTKQEATPHIGLKEQQAQAEGQRPYAEYSFNRPSTAYQAQPLRINHALHMYQQESAIRPQLVQTEGATGTTGLTGQLVTDTEQPVVMASQLTNHVATRQSTPQPVYTGTYQVQADQLTQTLSNMFVKQLKVNQLPNITEAKLVLNPRSLGQIDVRITSQDGVITAHFQANTQGGKELLDNQLAQLRAALVQQGLQVERLEVTYQATQEQRVDYQQHKEHEHRQQQGNQQQEQQNSDEQSTSSFASLLDEAGVAAWNQRRAGTISYSA